MRAVRRLLVLLGKMALLSAVGVPVYLYVRHVPCCTVDGFVELQALSADGRTLLVSDFSARWHKEEAGEDKAAREEPEQYKLIDARSGRVVQSFEQVSGCRLSPDGQRFACQIGPDIVVGDLLTRTHLTLLNSTGPLFTPNGKWLLVEQDKRPVLVDPESGRIVLQLAKDQPKSRFVGGDRFYCSDQFVELPHSDGAFDLIEVATGRPKRLPVSRLDFYGDIIASNNGRWFAFGDATEFIAFSGPGPIWEPSTRKRFWKCEIWDWEHRKQIASLPGKFDPWRGEQWKVIFSDDNRRVAVWNGYKELRDFKIIDLEARSEARVVFPAGFFAPTTLDQTPQSSSCSAHFSFDSAHFALDHSFNDGQRLAMIETATGHILWSKTHCGFVCFGPNGTCLLNEHDAQHHRNLQIAETKSGKLVAAIDANLRVDRVRMRFEPPFDDHRNYRVLSSFGDPPRNQNALLEWLRKHVPWLRLAESPGLAVVDLTTGRQRFAIQHDSRNFALSRDGNALATCRSLRGEGGGLEFWRIEVWDLQPHRALFWSVTVSIAVGFIGWLVGRKPWRRRAVSGGSK